GNYGGSATGAGETSRATCRELDPRCARAARAAGPRDQRHGPTAHCPQSIEAYGKPAIS
ncbi:hypothetical protein JYU34_007680, partial [Plutella xylostella]